MVGVGGSNPLGRTNSNIPNFKYFVAQLVRTLPLSMTRSKGLWFESTRPTLAPNT